MLHKTALYYLNLLNPISAKRKCLGANLVFGANKIQASYSEQITLWMFIIVKIDYKKDVIFQSLWERMGRNWASRKMRAIAYLSL